MAFILGKLDTPLIFLVIVIYFLSCPTLTSQDTRGQPVNVGLNIALPWDVSNTLRAPIGGPVAIMLSAIAAAALLLGLLLAPVHYLLGYPSRIYHPARKPGLISTLLYIDKERSLGQADTEDSFLPERISSMIADRNDSGDFDLADGRRSFTGSDTEKLFPDFISSAFFFIDEKDVECRKLLLCHAHGFLYSLPARASKVVRFFR